MFRLLRGIINLGTDDYEQMLKNFDILITRDAKFEKEEEKLVFGIVKKFVDEYRKVPVIETVNDELLKVLDPSAEELEILNIIKATPLLVDADYEKIVVDSIKQKRVVKLEKALRKGQNKILKMSSSSDIDKDIDETISQLVRDCYDITTIEENYRTYGDVTETKIEFLQDYEKKKKHLGQIGQLLGYEIMDLSFRGAKPGELILVAGFVGEGKTLFCKNVAYNQAVMFGYNVLFFSLEMKYQQLETAFYVLHSADPKWNREPLIYADVRDGLLDENDEKFLVKVSDDFNDKKKNHYGKLTVFQPREPMTIEDIRMVAQMENMKNPVDLLIIDYLTLLKLQKGQDITNLIKEIKNLAITFDRGRGIPIISPYQFNRDQKDKFDQMLAKGKSAEYSLTGLANSAEAERSADIVIATAFPQKYKEAGQIKVMNLKNRDNANFPSHFLQVQLTCGRIGNSSMSLEDLDNAQPASKTEQDSMSEIIDMLEV